MTFLNRITVILIAAATLVFPAARAEETPAAVAETVKAFISAWAKQDKAAALALCVGTAQEDVKRNFSKIQFDEKVKIKDAENRDGYLLVRTLIHASQAEEETEPIRFMIVAKKVGEDWKITCLDEGWNAPSPALYLTPEDKARIEAAAAPVAVALGKTADSPEALVHQLTAAYKLGDPELVGNLYIDSLRDLLKERDAIAGRLAASKKEILKAMEARFGPSKDPLEFPEPDLEERIERYQRVDRITLDQKTPVVGGMEISLTFDTWDKPRRATSKTTMNWLVVKQGEGWKFKYNDVDHRYLQDWLPRMTKIPAALDAVAKEIAAGKYAARDEAKKAVEAAYEQAIKIELPPVPSQK